MTLRINLEEQKWWDCLFDNVVNIRRNISECYFHYDYWSNITYDGFDFLLQNRRKHEILVVLKELHTASLDFGMGNPSPEWLKYLIGKYE